MSSSTSKAHVVFEYILREVEESIQQRIAGRNKKRGGEIQSMYQINNLYVSCQVLLMCSIFFVASFLLFPAIRLDRLGSGNLTFVGCPFSRNIDWFGSSYKFYDALFL